MKKEFKITSGLLVRNTILNFIGQAAPLLIAIITIPFIIQGLGVERFGILSLAWVIVGYFGLFDLGLGRATTKFVAESLGEGESEKLPSIVWTSVGLQTMLGIVGGLVLIVIIPLLVERVLNIPSTLLEETKNVFYLLALSIPVVVISTSWRGVLEAGQRFDLVNVVKIPATAAIFLFPLIGLFLGFQLFGIVALLVISRFAALLAFFIFSLKTFPSLKQKFAIRLRLLRSLLSYGGWITVSNIVGPILVYLDRFLIVILLTVAAVGYYTPPYEVVRNLSIIPASLALTLFPAFSALSTMHKEDLDRFYARSVKYLLLVMGPVMLILILFATDFLRLWLGIEFAQKSTLVLQILAIGALANSLAYVPFSLLQGLGRPDLPAKFHLLELPLYLGLAWFLIKNLGISGAALAWTLRVSLDAFLLLGASVKIFPSTLIALIQSGLRRTAIALFGLVTITLFVMIIFDLTTMVKIIFIGGFIILFSLASWRYVLDSIDKRVFAKLLLLAKPTKGTRLC